MNIRRDSWQLHIRATFLRAKVNPGLITFKSTLLSLGSQSEKTTFFCKPLVYIRVLGYLGTTIEGSSGQ